MGDNNNPDFKNITRDIKNVGNVDIGDKTYNTIYQEKPIPKALTTNIPLLSKDKIIGRDTYLDKLHQILFDKKDAILVNGFGGVGKTTIAQVYAHTFWDEYAHVAWITFNSDDFVFELVNAPGLKESLNISADGVDIQQLFSRLMVEINRIGDKPNLLILDNAVEKLSQFKSYLPSSHEWHILVTAREDINGFTSHYLDFLDEADAIALFKHHYTLKIITDDQINQLVRKADYHTLTIEILAKTAQLQRLSFDTLKEALRQDIKSGVRTSRSGQEKIENITGYLLSIFNLIALDENEIWLLKNLLFLPSDYHSYELLNTIIDPASSSKKDIFAETLTSLTQKTWILYNEETDSYKMHIVVAEVLKKNEVMHFEDISGLINSLSNLLHLDQEKENPTDKFIWIPFGKHVFTNFPYIQNVSFDDRKKLSLLLLNLGLRYKNLGQYKQATLVLTEAMNSLESILGTDNDFTLISYSILANVLKYMGQLEQAKDLLTKVMSYNEKNYGCEHPKTAKNYSNLGLVYQELGEYEKAKELLTKALSIMSKEFGSDHPETSICFYNLGTLLNKLGKNNRAKIYLKFALDLDKKNLGEYHPTTAKTYENLALVLGDLGDIEQQKLYLNKAIIANRKNFGDFNIFTITSYSNLATVLQKNREYLEAKVLFSQTKEFLEKHYGLEYPLTATSYSNLATVHKNLGEYEQAKDLLTKAMHSNKKNLGPEHPSSAIIYANLSVVLFELNEIDEAKVLAKKALDIFKMTLPVNHPTIKTVEGIYKHLISLS